MALPNDYAGQACSLARSLEIIGERWTLLIVRDAFWGVRRFADFIDHLGIPRAVLASRLKTLVAAGVLTRVAGERHLEYELTDKGTKLWPIVRDLMAACRDLAAAGQTIVLVEQNLAATLTLAQRIYIINNGHIVHEGPAQEIKAQPEVLHRYLGV